MSIVRLSGAENGTHGAVLWPFFMLWLKRTVGRIDTLKTMIVKMLRRNKPGNKTGYKTALGLPLADWHATRPSQVPK